MVPTPGDGLVLFADSENGGQLTAKLPDGSNFILSGASSGGDVSVLNWPVSYPVTGTFWQATQPVSGTFWQAVQPVSGTVSVGNFPASQAVTGAFYPATQPVSGTFWQATQPVSGTFWQTTQPVSIALPVAVTGTFWQATQPVSGTVAVSSVGGTVAVTGAFFQATQPASAAALPLPSGASTETTLSTLNGKVTACNTGSVTVATCALPSGASTAALQTSGNASLTSIDGKVTTCNTGAVTVSACSAPALSPASLCVTGTAAAGSGVTITLPSVVGQFHYVSSIRISAYNVAARTGGATPVVVTTTNLPGSLAFTFGSAGAIGTIEAQQLEIGGNPIKSSVAATNTTIVCPATTSVIWRVTAVYSAAP